MNDFKEPDFNLWTEIIGSYFFSNSKNYGRTIALTCDVETLSDCIKSFREGKYVEIFSSDNGELLVFQVKSQFSHIVHQWLKENSFNWLPNDYVNGYPKIIPLVASQVLAVYEMKRQVGAMGQTPYWPCLQRMFGCDRYCHCIPKVRQYECQRELWKKFLAWVNVEKKGMYGKIEVPTESIGNRCHINMPFSQALLRKVDLERTLSILFADYPNNIERCEHDFDELCRFIRKFRFEKNYFGKDYFLNHAQCVLSDDPELVRSKQVPDRFTPACRQIFEYISRNLEAIVPKPSLPASRKPITNPASELWFALKNRETKLKMYLAQPGDVNLVPFLLDNNKVGYILNPKTPFCFPNDWGTPPPKLYVSNSSLLGVYDGLRYCHRQTVAPGEDGAIICFGDPTIWIEHLELFEYPPIIYGSSNIEKKIDRLKSLKGLPSGCHVIQFRLRNTLPSDISFPWNKLIAFGKYRLKVEGGLRLKRTFWVTGTPLRLLIEGVTIPTEIEIDDETIQVEEIECNIPYARLGMVIKTFETDGIHRICLQDNNESHWIRTGTPEKNNIYENWYNHRWIFNEKNWPFNFDNKENPQADAAYCFGARLNFYQQTEKEQRCFVDERKIALEFLIQESEGIDVPVYQKQQHPLIRYFQSQQLSQSLFGK